MHATRVKTVTGSESDGLCGHGKRTALRVCGACRLPKPWEHTSVHPKQKKSQVRNHLRAPRNPERVLCKYSRKQTTCLCPPMQCHACQRIATVRAEHGSGKGVEYGMCGMQGWRKTMEDAHIALAKVSSNDDMALFAVFDGHGGSEVAKFCAKYMVPELLNLASFAKGDYDSALKEAFHRIDTMLMDQEYAGEIAAVRCCSDSSVHLRVHYYHSRSRDEVACNTVFVSLRIHLWPRSVRSTASEPCVLDGDGTCARSSINAM